MGFRRAKGVLWVNIPVLDLFKDRGKRRINFQEKIMPELAGSCLGLRACFLALGILDGLMRGNPLGICLDLLHGGLELLALGLAQVG